MSGASVTTHTRQAFVPRSTGQADIDLVSSSRDAYYGSGTGGTQVAFGSTIVVSHMDDVIVHLSVLLFVA